jgi:hypothetical protein
MIKDQESFEAALQRVADLLEHPPARGTREDEEFGQLLHDIELFQPTFLAAPRESDFARLGKEAQALLKEANAFQARREERERREKLTSFPEDGHGIGPTTGV